MSIITALVGPVANLLDQFIEDKDQKAKLAHEIATMSQKHMSEAMMANAQANIEQSKHASIFVSGARPAIMWICALGLFTQFFLMPIAEWAIIIWMPEIDLPKLNTGELMTLTLSLLGLGGLRSFEKSRGIAREKIK